MAKREVRTARDAAFTIRLSPDRASKLQELAKEAGRSPEDLLQTQVESWLSEPRADFEEAAIYVLKKNAELYRRLA
jgi:predicted transcriptional regulator